ncbi:MAG TPA: NAD-dependent epimerase/dehydratase family protein [Thermoanaerobaculia bacterium]|nr:NAD-dependent epimerase/dehydratase family protein [Thermoanaerobaculia bacterium]
MSAPPSYQGLAGRRVLITGGTGFIGGRLAERLILEVGAEVRALVRTYTHASRLARFPIELVQGDVVDERAVRRAADGCDVVFHCAYGTSGTQRHRARVNLKGTESVLGAAAAAGVRRVVHLSTLMVYGATEDGDLDERSPRRFFGDAYSNSKLRAESLALSSAASRDLEVTVLQPTAVYGPFGGVWTRNVMSQLASGRVILVDGGSGLCNAVYIDDLVSAMLLAAVEAKAAGEAFLISGEEPFPWSELYGAFETMMGLEERTVTMSAKEARSHYRHDRWNRPSIVSEGLRMLRGDEELRDRVLATREASLAQWMISTVLPEAAQKKLKRRLLSSRSRGGPEPRDSDELPIHPMSPLMVKFFLPKTRVRIDKAKELLGYRPAFDFAAGMERTREWAQWANLLS